jgi:hypothetical protein
LQIPDLIRGGQLVASPISHDPVESKLHASMVMRPIVIRASDHRSPQKMFVLRSPS